MARPADHIKESRPVAADDRSLGELISDLSRETTTLVREEVELAKVEMKAKATEVGRDIGFLAAGGAVAYAGLLALIAAAIIGIAQAGLTPWLSALLVGIVVAGIGGYLVWKGIENLRKGNIAPTQTIQTLKEDQQWARDQVK